MLEQQDKEEESLSFNDLPLAMTIMLNKIEKIEIAIAGLREDVWKSRKPLADQHQPIELEEACKILKMSKSSLYHYVQGNLVPATKKGKKYIFFKDELIKWIESGRRDLIPAEPEIVNKLLSHRRRK